MTEADRSRLLEIGLTHRPPWTTLHLAGELDMESSPHLSDRVDDQLERGHCRLTVDLSGLTFCDSRGLATLIHAAVRCRNAGGVLRLSGATGTVARVLEITGVDDLLAGDRSVVRPAPAPREHAG